MIIATAPLRICLGGGGTDLPSYHLRHGGFWVSGAIDKYVTVCIRDDMREQPPYDSYGRKVFDRMCALAGIDARKKSLAIVNSLPPGLGLGSSGALAAAINCAVNTLAMRDGFWAATIEIDLLDVGYQDTLAAWFGGVRSYSQLAWQSHDAGQLNDSGCLHLYYTGLAHDSTEMLQKQNDETRAGNPKTLELLHATKEIGKKTHAALCAKEPWKLGDLFNQHWELKRQLGSKVSSPQIEKWRAIAIQAGASGVKLLGSGGGGFLLCQCPSGHRSVTAKMEEAGLTHLPFKFIEQGAKTVFHG